jgi:serine/threonine-protein kinase
VLEPEYFAALTPEEREELRLWHGRGNLLDRVKTFRRYALSTLVMTGLSIIGVAFGVEEEIPPLVFTPLIPIYMSMKVWRRSVSLRLSGLRMRRVLFGMRSRKAFPAPPTPPSERHLEKLVSREVLDGPHGSPVRQAVDDRGAILAIVAGLDKSDRALLPDLEPTVKGLVDRVAHLARMLHRLDGSIDPRLVGELDARIIQAERDVGLPEGERRIALLRRQRTTLDEIMERRAVLARQLDNAALALANLRFDLIKVRSSGLQSALGDVSEATQEARALSREIGALLEASAEAKGL